MELVAPVCHVFLRAVLRVMADYHVYGRENVPSRSPFILVANHQSNMDPPLLAASLGRPARFLAKESLFSNPLYTAFFRRYGAFPTRRDGRDLAATRWALRRLKEGYVQALFPEGTRNPGAMKRALPGAAYLALTARVPILPAAITGTERLGPLWRVVLPTGRLTVTFGEPFTLPSLQGRLDHQRLEELTELIMGRVAALLPEQYRGVYGAVEGQSVVPIHPGRVDRR